MSNTSGEDLSSTDRSRREHKQTVQDQRNRSEDSEPSKDALAGLGAKPTAEDSGPPFSKKKRKRDTALEALHDNESQRLRGYYNNNYRQLLNKEISQASRGNSGDETRSLYPSQLGASIWTSREKSILFTSVSRLGKADIAGAAAAIRTKSEAEVHDYISLLQNGLSEAHLNLPRPAPVTLADIPAAVELSDDCCNKLGIAGEAIAWYQFRWDAKQEEARHGAYWLLNRRIAEEIEVLLSPEHGLDYEDLEDASDQKPYQMQEGEAEKTRDQVHEREGNADGKGEGLHDRHTDGSTVLDAVPAAKLLRLKQWIQLSESVFMNPGSPRESENWRLLADAGEEPSLFKTAFDDFHRVTVSVTQRLVQASLFQALSRLRTSDRDRSHTRQLSVNKKDVLTAIEVLGMHVNSKSFWIEAARRCSLAVYKTIEDFRKRSPNDPLGYETVEKILKREGLTASDTFQAGYTEDEGSTPASRPRQTDMLDPETQSSGTNSEHSGYSSAEEIEGTGGSGLYGDGLDTVEIRDTLTDISEAERSAERLRKQHRNRRDILRLELEQDEYTEGLDQRTSLKEERYLTKMLRHEARVDVKEEVESASKRPPVERKNEIDWRDWIDYQAAWERPENLHSGRAAIKDMSIGRTTYNASRK